MIARICLAAATVFVAVVALAHAQQQHPRSASFTLTDARFTLDGAAPSKQVTVALGATVRFAYPEGVGAHNVHIERAGPSCTQQAGAGAGNSSRILPNPPEGPGWAISCRFDRPGIYHFVCDEHGTLNGIVRVANADGSVPTENPPGANPETPAVPNGPAPAGADDGTTRTASPRARTAPKWSIARSQRGSAVRATLTGGSERGTIVLEALARRADLRAKGKAKLVRVGRASKTVAAGARATVSVALNAKGKSALKRLGRLELTLRVTVAGETSSKRVTLRR